MTGCVFRNVGLKSQLSENSSSQSVKVEKSGLFSQLSPKIFYISVGILLPPLPNKKNLARYSPASNKLAHVFKSIKEF